LVPRGLKVIAWAGQEWSDMELKTLLAAALLLVSSYAHAEPAVINLACGGTVVEDGDHLTVERMIITVNFAEQTVTVLSPRADAHFSGVTPYVLSFVSKLDPSEPAVSGSIDRVTGKTEIDYADGEHDQVRSHFYLVCKTTIF
jgi:hypothetical protein